MACVLLPLLNHAGVDLVHFGVFFVVNVMLSGESPLPQSVDHVPGVRTETMSAILSVAKGGVAFIIACIALLIITYVPILTLWLARPDHAGVLLPSSLSIGRVRRGYRHGY